MSFNSGNREFEYKPEQGNQTAVTATTRAYVQDGYHNLPNLKEMLALIIEQTNVNIAESEKILEGFSLIVDPESRLERAQAQEWPTKLSDPKGSVHYRQYKALRKLKTRSSDYIVKQYEKYARGPSGDHNVDLVLANECINCEAKNIIDFIDNYIGYVNNTSEYRTIEILQDWAQDAVEFTGQLRSLANKGTKNEATESIPESEMDKISRPNAIQFQTLFKTKVNAFNEEILQIQEDLNKSYGTYSKIFYERFLGPTLKFDIDLSRSLVDLSARGGFLGMQASSGEQSFAFQMEQMLIDSLKRNEEFRAKMQGLIFTISKRDDYNRFINQLAVKGSTVKPFFTSTASLEQEEKEYFDTLEKEYASTEVPLIEEEFLSDHNTLDGLDHPEAHPQYLLKDGDVISGDIKVAPGVKIDNVDLDLHNHDGVNTPKIKGSDIEGGTLPTDVIDLTQRPPTPTALIVKNATQDVLTSGMVVWDVTLEWEGQGEFTYEIQAAPYDQAN